MRRAYTVEQHLSPRGYVVADSDGTIVAHLARIRLPAGFSATTPDGATFCRGGRRSPGSRRVDVVDGPGRAIVSLRAGWGLSIRADLPGERPWRIVSSTRDPYWEVREARGRPVMAVATSGGPRAEAVVVNCDEALPLAMVVAVLEAYRLTARTRRTFVRALGAVVDHIPEPLFG